jgi:hypothetical protein
MKSITDMSIRTAVARDVQFVPVADPVLLFDNYVD